jgi:hypothetical protein
MYFLVLGASSTWGWVSFINSAPINILTWPQEPQSSPSFGESILQALGPCQSV